MRTGQASPCSNFQGVAAMVARLPLTQVDVAADLLDRRDAGGGEGLVGGEPLREVLLGVPAGRRRVLDGEALHLRAAAMRAHRGRERDVDERRVDGHELRVLLDEPLGGVLGQARRLAEVLEPVGVLVMPAGHDDDDVAVLHGRGGGLEVGGRDDLPALLGDVEHGGVAEEAVRGDGGQVVAALDHVDGGVHVRARVQAGDDAPGEHAVLGVLDGALHAHVELARLRRDPVAPHVAELDELKPGVGICDDSVSFRRHLLLRTWSGRVSLAATRRSR